MRHCSRTENRKRFAHVLLCAWLKVGFLLLQMVECITLQIGTWAHSLSHTRIQTMSVSTHQKIHGVLTLVHVHCERPWGHGDTRSDKGLRRADENSILSS